MDAVKVSDLLSAARNGDQAAREALLDLHRSFIFRQACRVAGRFLDWRNDDELSIALMAFEEAVTQYDPARGSFLSFARQVIRNRILDYYRRERRHAVVPLDVELPDEDEDLAYSSNEVEEAWERYAAEEEQASIAAEVAIFKEELGRFGITLSDLVRASPKHRDTKETLLRIARTLLSDPELCERFQRTRQLPLRELQARTGVSRRVLESGRRYIVAVAIVMLHPDLPRIRNYIQLPELKEV